MGQIYHLLVLGMCIKQDFFLLHKLVLIKTFFVVKRDDVTNGRRTMVLSQAVLGI